MHDAHRLMGKEKKKSNEETQTRAKLKTEFEIKIDTHRAILVAQLADEGCQ